MSYYRNVMSLAGDQWVAALQCAEDAVNSIARGARSGALATSDVPEPLSRLGEILLERFPAPSAVVQAQFEVTERVLKAQRDLMLRVIALADGTAVPSSTEVVTADAKSTVVPEATVPVVEEAAPLEKAVSTPAKKVVPAKRATSVKKVAPAKRATPVKRASSTAAAKKVAPVNKTAATPAKRVAPVKKAVATPAKKVAPAKEN